MAWVAGKPKLASERYVGSAAEIEALLVGREQAMVPERTRHLAFGDLAAVWWVIQRLGVVEIVDEVVGDRRRDAGASVGTYLALATLNRVVAPRSKLGFADWWSATAGDHLVKVKKAALDHRRFWDAMHAVDAEALVEAERRIAARMIETFALDTSSLALDMTNFATYIDSTNPKAPIAQRGKAKQKRSDLRLVGLGLVVTRDGGVPLLSHAYPGNKPDVTQFASMIDELATRHRGLGADTGELTVVFDAGQNSEPNFDRLAGAGLRYVGSLPPSGHPQLLAIPVTDYQRIDEFDGVHAHEVGSIDALGRIHRGLLTHSAELHAGQARGLEQTLAKTEATLAGIREVLASGRGRRDRATLDKAIDTITSKRWVRDVLTATITGQSPATFRLDWHIDQAARHALEERLFGKRILITDRHDWTVPEIIAGYRSQADAEFGFRQLKDPHAVSFSPMHHWTEHNIRVHVFYCVLALTIAHLMRRHADQHGHHLSVRALLDALAGIQETVLIYASTGGRPKARRMLTETTHEQDQLAAIFQLDRWAPPNTQPTEHLGHSKPQDPHPC
ncbi:MAG: IS1634 family transposase [Pseudonocardiaceae bacterium]